MLIREIYSESGLTALQMACQAATPNAEVIRALLENGSYANIVGKDGDTPFASILRRYLDSLDGET